MTSISTRVRLLGGAAMGMGMAALLPQQAMAQCTVSPAATPVTGTVNCVATVTTDTTYTGAAATASDRNYNVDTAAGSVTGTVTGAVTGFGLAFTNTGAGGNTLNVINNGGVTLGAGNTAIAGGTAALNVTAIGATNVVYTGTGAVSNLGIGGNALQFDMNGTGTLNATIGGNVTAGATSGGYGVIANLGATAGNATLTTLAGTTILTDYLGITIYNFNSASTANTTVVNNAAIGSLTGAPNTFDYGVSTINDGLGSTTITNNGAIGSSTDRVQSWGIEALKGNASATSALTVNGSGAIWSASEGIHAENGGSGATTINYTGVINSTGTRGIDVTAATGATTVTTGAGAVSATGAGGVGINVAATTGATTVTTGAGAVTGADYGVQVATTGTQAITANGVVTGTAIAGIHSNTTAARTITVGTAGNVTGGTEAILIANTGTATVTNSGIIGTVAGLAIQATGAGATAITNNAGATLNGRLTLTGNNDSLTNAGTWATAGTSDFGAGTDTLTNSGTATFGAASVLLGLETVTNSGTINAATGLTFDGGATAFTNNGTVNLAGALDFGAGTDSFTNGTAGILTLTGNASLVGAETFTQSGRINLATFTLTGPAVALTNAGTIDTGGNAGLAGFTSLSNTGTLDLAAGTFTAPAGAFTNSGTILADEGASTITGQASFANTGTIDLQDGDTTDVLTINSSFAGSGSSALLVDYSGAAADRLVITGAASGTTRITVTPTAGLVINPTGVLVVDAATSSANAFVLGSTVGNALIDLSLVQTGADFFLVSRPNNNAFDPLALGNLAQDMWYQSADTYGAYSAHRRTDLGPDRASNLGVWGLLYFSKERYGERETQSVFGSQVEIDGRQETKRKGIQGGLDYSFGSAVVGVTGGYQRADSNLRTGPGGFDAKGYNLGLYGMVGSDRGFYAGALIKRDRNRAELTSPVFDSVDKLTVRSIGIEGEAGYRMALSENNALDIGGGLAWVRTKYEDFSFSGISYDYDTSKSLRGRIGGRLELGRGLGSYIDARLLHEFKGETDVTLLSGTAFDTLESEGRGTWGRFELGFGARGKSGPMAGVWLDRGDVKGFGLRAGWRFGGGAVDAPPPPPPPPEPERG